jgi:MFS family permease
MWAQGWQKAIFGHYSLALQIFALMAQTRQDSAYDALKIPAFRNYLIARTLITFGINIVATTVGWQIYELTGEPFSLGMIGLAEFLPFLVVTLIGGYVADLVDRRSIILACVATYICCTIALYLFSSTWSEFLQPSRWGVWPIFVIIGLTGLIRGFLSPANYAFSAQLVPTELLGNSSTWTTMSWHISAVGGPAVGGALCAISKGASLSYTVTILICSIGLGMILSVPSQHKAADKKPRENLFTSVGEGLKFVFKNQILLGALALDMFAVLFGGAVALLPAFAKDVLQVDATGFGALRAAPAVGALVMAWILAYRPANVGAGKKMLLAVAGFGVCTVLFAISTNFWFSLLMLAGTGFFDNVSMVIRGTIVQLFTPNEMRGRVSAVNSIFVGSSNELGAFESGLAARLMGLVPSVVFGGCMTILVVGMT